MSDDPHAPDELPPSSGTVDEASLLPVERDRRFLFRLVALLLVGAIAASFVGLKLRSAAGSCGATLLRPGGTVIPPPRGAR